MAKLYGKKFSLISFKDTEIIVNGYIEPIELEKIDDFLVALGNISTYEKVDVTIEHLRYKTEDSNIETMDKETFDLLVSKFDEIVEDDLIFIEEEVCFSTFGLSEEVNIIE